MELLSWQLVNCNPVMLMLEMRVMRVMVVGMGWWWKQGW